jgi:predicted transposase YbfD/YdcC
MKNNIPHSVYLQDGSVCNFRKRVWKGALPLLFFLRRIPDPRQKRGIRHEVSLMLFILFAAMTTGCTTIKDCRLWGVHNQQFLRRYFALPHGIPDANTFSNLLRILSPEEVGKAYLEFLRLLGVNLGDVISADGKTMRAVTGRDAVRHILSLFSHLSHTLIEQIGVDQKENEIPALRRLLEANPGSIAGKLLLADALHTNAETAGVITTAGADYVLVVKGNQKDFFAAILFAMTAQPDLPGTNYQATAITKDICVENQKTRKRSISTTVTTTNDQTLCAYLIKQHGFAKLQTVGVLHRTGTRTSKDGTVTAVDETICFVSSRKLSAKQITSVLRNHWCIENNLHWVKDFVFLEDRQTLRSGNAPQIMSLLRSMCISIGNLVKFQSISDALHNFQKSKPLQYQFLRMAAIV